MDFIEWGNKQLEEENEKLKERSKVWKKAHPEKVETSRRRWKDANPEKSNACIRNWNKAHPERVKAALTKYYETHREEVKKRSKVWVKNHPERRNIICKRAGDKRKRNLGYVPLNAPFEGSDGHHIDKDYIIFILSELHESISHSVLTGKNMKEINKLVLDYFEKRKEVTVSGEQHSKH